ncbi:clathrin light chain [Toxoplasma gondii p89]|uniref:Clathrin light chain n=1 Tax=Toxoplasma gondii p89 TaxID=943119 RepID=A0A086KIN9_TOXGO|nr:clathrin light chain [Toxoplasma gondii p89]
MDGDFGATGGGFGDMADFTSSPGLSLNAPVLSADASSPFSRSPRHEQRQPQLSSGSGGYEDVSSSVYSQNDYGCLNGVRSSPQDDDAFFAEEPPVNDSFLEENDVFAMGRENREVSDGYSPPSLQTGSDATQKRDTSFDDRVGPNAQANGVYGLPQDSPLGEATHEEPPKSAPGQQAPRMASGSVEAEIDEQARQAAEAMQEQLRQEVEGRRREEEALKREQRELAQEELKDFYERRKQMIERRSKANQAKENETPNGFGDNREGSWTRVIQLIDADDRVRSRAGSSAGAATSASATASSKDRCKMRELLVELSAQEKPGESN